VRGSVVFAPFSRQFGDLRVDVGHSPAEVIYRHGLARRGILALLREQPNIGVRVLDRVHPPFQLGPNAAERIEVPLQARHSVLTPQRDTSRRIETVLHDDAVALSLPSPCVFRRFS
jgi:hypothetical protein